MRNWIRLCVARLFPWLFKWKTKTIVKGNRKADPNRFIPRANSLSELVLPNGLSAAAGAFGDMAVTRSLDDRPPIHEAVMAHRSDLSSDGDGSVSSLLALILHQDGSGDAPRGNASARGGDGANALPPSTGNNPSPADRDEFFSLFQDPVRGVFENAASRGRGLKGADRGRGDGDGNGSGGAGGGTGAIGSRGGDGTDGGAPGQNPFAKAIADAEQLFRLENSLSAGGNSSFTLTPQSTGHTLTLSPTSHTATTTTSSTTTPSNTTTTNNSSSTTTPTTPSPSSTEKISTTVTLTDTDAVYGQPVTITATVTPASGSSVSEGSVKFYDNGSFLGSADVSNGKAVLTTNDLQQGTNAFQGIYSGSANYKASISPVLDPLNNPPPPPLLAVVNEPFDPSIESLSGNLGSLPGPYHVLPTGQGPIAVQIGHVAGQDLNDVVALNVDGTLSVALNNDNGYWRSVTSYATGLTQGNGLALGRFFNHPVLDAAVQGPDSILILESNGIGQFWVAQTINAPSAGAFAPANGGTVQPAVINLDNSGLQALVTVSPGTNEVLVYPNLGNGFGTPEVYPSGASQPVSVVVGDFVGDALPDIAVGHRNGSVTFLQGMPGGTFQARPDLTVTGLGAIHSMAAGNFAGTGLELAVSSSTGVTLLSNSRNPADFANAIANGTFTGGLTGWTVASGTVISSRGITQLQESSTALTSTLKTTFTVPDNPQSLSFDLADLGLELPNGGVPDAFEVSLLDGQNNSLVPTFSGNEATSFINWQPDGTVSKGSGVTFDGRKVTLNISQLPPGSTATLVFDLIGNTPGTASTASIANVKVTQAIDETFSTTTLASDSGFAGIAAGDVNGDRHPDIVVANTPQDALVVYTGDGTGAFTPSTIGLSGFGTGASAVAAAPLLPGSTTDNLAIALTASNLVVDPLIFDTVSPQAVVTSPSSGQLVYAGISQVQVQFSEAVVDNGATGNHSVTNPAAYVLTNADTNQTIPIASVTYNPTSFLATLTVASPLLDGDYQITINGSSSLHAIEDRATNHLNGGSDTTSPFEIDTVPLVVQTASNLSGNEGQTLSFTGSFTDSITAKNHIATINWGDGTTNAGTVVESNGSGTVSASHVYADEGSYTVTLTVTNDHSTSSSLGASATIGNAAPTALTASDPTGSEGQTLTFSGTFSDPGTADTHTALVAWGDGTTSVGTIVEANGHGAVTATHAYVDEGTYNITLTVTDDDGLSASLGATATVNNAAPVVVTASNLAGIEGQTLNFTGTFTDAGTADTHTALVAWGDGTTSIGTVVESNGYGTVTASHAYGDQGPFTITLTVTDDDGASGSLGAIAAVANVAPTVLTASSENGTEGQLLAFTGTFFDPGVGKTHTALIAWGDGTTSVGTVVETNGWGTVTGSHTYAEEGTYTITLTVTDNHGASGSLGATAAIANATPVVVTASSLSGNEGQSLAFAGTFSDAGTADTHTAVIHWGDGTTSNGTVSESNGQGTVTATHTYADNGSYTITLTVTDDGGASSSLGAAASISNVAPVLTASNLTGNEGQALTFTGTFSDPGTADTHTATINWGDGTTSNGTVSESNGQGTVTATHTYADNGSYTITLTVTDDDGASASLGVTASIANVAPTLTPSSDISVNAQQSVTATLATFTDPGFTSAAAGTQETFTASINWGDGTLTSGTVQVTQGSAGVLTIGSVSGTHTYQQDGNYTVTVTVTDDDNGSSSATLTAHVQNSTSSLSGKVYVDANQDGVRESGESGLAGVTITLTGTDVNNASVNRTTVSTSDGSYQFTGLIAGTYAIAETPPAAYLAGQTSIGTVNGTRDGHLGPLANQVTGIVLSGGSNGVGYDFGAITPSGGTSSITSNFNGTAIATGNSIWFSSVLKASSLGSGPVTIRFVNQTITFTANSTNYTLTVPNATITYSPATTVSTTTYDATTNTWVTNVPLSGLSGNQFLSGLIDFLTVGLPGSIHNVQWSGQFLSDTPGVSVNWQWAAAAYTSFSSNPSALGVKPVDDNHTSQYQNSDHAGTPENYKTQVTAGATGGGASNYTGSLSATASVTPAANGKAEFFVVDPAAADTFRYGSSGGSVGPGSFPQDPAALNPRGVVANSTGTTLWTIDGTTHDVVVQKADGTVQGTWLANGLQSPQGIASNGTDLWIVDAGSKKVLRYTNGVSLTSGSASAASSFNLAAANSSPSDIATDGTDLWVTDDSQKAIFVYNLSGTLLGQWSLDSRNVNPSGLTLNASGGTDLWVVDRQTKQVFHYTNATGRRSGSQNAADVFNLSASDTDPEGIADPTTPITLGQTVNGTLNVAGQVDSYSFAGSVGQQVFLSALDNDGGAITFSILNPDGSVLVPASASNEGPVLLPTTGAYTVVVQGGVGVTGAYRFGVSNVGTATTPPPARVANESVALDPSTAQDVTDLGQLVYRGTTFNRHTGVLHVSVTLSNTSTVSLGGNVTAAISPVTPPAVSALVADDYLPDGRALIGFTDEIAGGNLLPGQTTSSVALGFYDDADLRFTFNVALLKPASHAVTFQSQPPTQATVGLLYSYTPTATGGDGSAFTFALSNPPAGMTINASTGAITWTPATSQLGSQVVTITVSDAHGDSASQSVYVQVLPAVSVAQPVIYSSPRTSILVGQTYRYDVMAIDSGSLALTYALVNKPAGMSIDANAGVLTWDTTGVTPGAFTVTVTATNPNNLAATQTFTLNVLNVAAGSVQGTVFNDLNGNGVQGAAAGQTQVFDPAQQFSATNNPNGAWRYGWRPSLTAGSTFNIAPAYNDYASEGIYGWSGAQSGVGESPAIYYNPSDQVVAIQQVREEYWGPHELTMLPGRGAQYADLRFIAPFNGTFQIGALFAARDAFDTGTDVHVQVNGVNKFDDVSVGGHNPLLNLSGLTLQQGDIVDFMVGYGPDQVPYHDMTLLNAKITATPQTSEPGLSGWTVYVDQNGDGRLDAGDPTTVTNAQGQYQFSNLAPGTYRVAEVPPAGWLPTTPPLGSALVTVASSIATTQNFGNQVASGANQTPGTVTANDVPVIVSTPASTQADVGVAYTYAVQATDPGNLPLTYSLTAAPAGMAIDPATGLVSWTPASGQTGNKTVTIQVQNTVGSTATQTFVLSVTDVAVGSISGNVFTTGISTTPTTTNLTVNATDAIFLAGRTDVTIPPLGSTNPTFPLARHNPNGVALETFPQGVSAFAGETFTFAATGLANPGFASGFPPDGVGGISDINPVAGISGYYGATVFPLVGVFLTDNNPGFTSTPATIPFRYLGTNLYTLTPGIGQVFFVGDGLTSGGVAQQFVAPAGATRLFVGMPDAAGFGGPAGYYDDNSGNLQVTIHGQNSTASQLGQAGWTVYLDQNQNGRLDGGEVSTVTDAQGNYTFGNVAPGNYVVAEQPQSGWVVVAPPTGVYTANVTAGATVTGLNFQNAPATAGNHAPQFTTAAPTSGTAGQAYIYHAHATDADGDTVTYQLFSGPSGMVVDPRTGTVAWVPTSAQTGDNTITIRANDGTGNVTSQTFTVHVAPATINLAFTSLPGLSATSGQPYTYTATVQDTAGQTPVFTLVGPPAGMTIDAAGHLSWSPQLNDIGAPVIVIEASDQAGQTAFQTFQLTVHGPNVAATFSSLPLTTVTAGTTYHYTAIASAPYDGVTYSLVNPLGGMTINPTTGLVTWHPTTPDIGNHPLTIRATTDRGTITDQPFTLAVIADTTAPVVSILLNQPSAAIGQTVGFRVVATDDVAIAQLSLTINGQPVALDANGVGTFTPSTGGVQPFVATATDTSGNVGAATASLPVADPNDTTAPTVAITNPASESAVSYLTQITGTVTDPNLLSWKVEYSLVNSDEWHLITQGTTPLVNSALATFDPTLLQDDVYTIRLTGVDTNGQTSEASINLNVIGHAKIGEYVTGATDLSIQLAGDLSLTIARQYSTLNADETGDLGFGWHICALDPQIRETRPTNPFETLVGQFAAVPLKVGDKVYITTPDCQREGFTFTPVPITGEFASVDQYGALYQPHWTPDPGVTDQLYGEYDFQALDGFTSTFDASNGLPLPLIRTVDGSFLIAEVNVPYNPQGFRIVRKDQTDWHYSKFTGLEDVTDRNGNTMTVTPNGITTSSGGPSIQFNRDANGRITSIVDPAGHSINYEYDGSGNLKKVENQSDVTSEYEYEDPSNPHFMTTQGGDLDNCGCASSEPPQSMSYDTEGRLFQVFDALGAVTATQKYSLPDHTEQVADAFGKITNITYDERGNVTKIVTPMNESATGEYDSNDNLTAATDENGNTVHMAYDDRRNLTSLTDALNLTISQTFNAQNKVTSQTDARGNTYNYGYDSRSNMTSITAPADVPVVMAYDSQGRVLASNDFNGNPQLYGYDTGPNPTLVTYANQTTAHMAYNDLGLMTSYTDENGHTTTMGYNDSGTLTSITDPLNQNTSMTYVGKLVQTVTNTDGQITHYNYDANDRLTSVVGPMGYSTGYGYDTKGEITSETDALGRTTTFRYDADGRQTDRLAPLAHNTHYTFDATGNIATETDGNGHTTTYHYDKDNNVTTVTDPLNKTWAYDYDAVGNLKTETDPNNHTTSYLYDARNHLTQMTDAVTAVTMYEYDDNGNLTKVTDPNQHVTRNFYNSENLLSATIDPMGGLTQYQYDPANNVTAVTDANNHTTQYGYDKLNRRTSETDPAGKLWQTTYTATDQVSTTTDPLNHTTSYQYDPLRRLTQATDPANGTTLYGYDLQGNLTSSTDPIIRTNRFEYDAADQLTKVTDAAGGVTRYGYDHVGNQTSVTDPNTHTATFHYDVADQLTQEIDARGAVTQYAYDPAGNLTALTDANTNTTVFHYDAVDQLTQQTDTLGHSSYFVYDPAGNLTQTTDRNGRVIQYAYDPLDRETSETWLNGSTVVDAFNYHYDAVGNLKSAEDNNSQYHFTYDVRDQLKTSDNAGTPNVPNVVFTYGYDAVGNNTSVADNAGVTVASTYNSRDLLETRTWSGGGIDPASVGMNYDAAWQLKELDRYSDTTGTNTVSKSVYDYDPAGRVKTITHQDGNANTIADYQYHYDLAGQLTSETHHGITFDYQYDFANQLTNETRSDQPPVVHTYDANGNRTDSGIVPGPDNRISQDSQFTYQYDFEGNLTQKTDKTTQDVTTYTYDFRNRLTDVTTTTSPANGGVVLHSEQYTYDAFDRRIAVTVNGTTRFTVYNGDNAWADYNADGTVQTRYLFGDETDQILARWQPGSGTAWYLTDALGTIRDIVNAAGQLIDHIDYTAFGAILSETNPSTGDRFKFTGREYDAGTGLYYYRARYYDPVLGRFLGEDPLSFGAGDANLYRYVGNDPTGGTDPSGQDALVERGIEFAVNIGAAAAEAAIAAGLNTSCHLLDAWAQDRLTDDVWQSELQNFFATVEEDITGLLAESWNILSGGFDSFGGGSIYTPWEPDFYTEGLFRNIESTVVNRAFGAIMGPLGGALMTIAAPDLLMTQVYFTGIGLQEAWQHYQETGDKRLLLVRSACASIDLGLLLFTWRLNLHTCSECMGHCFPAGTLVSTEHGQRPIETIRAGERVWAMDLKDGEWKLRHVMETFERVNDGELLSIHVGNDTIYVTPGHPFWVVQGQDLESRPWPEHAKEPLSKTAIAGRWVDAGDLQVGDLLHLRNGNVKEIQEILLVEDTASVYNFLVEELACYSVGSGAILVHNGSNRTRLQDLRQQYVNPRLNVDMRRAPPGSRNNAAGYPRNGPWFFKQLLAKFPEAFSDANKRRINGRKPRCPKVDQQWLDFVQRQGKRGQKLVHHHLNQGPIATPLPENVHKDNHKLLHPKR